MNDDERREIEELRAQLAALRDTLDHLEARVSRLTADPGPRPPVAEPVPAGEPGGQSRPVARVPRSYVPRSQRPPREPTELEQRLTAGVKALISEGNPLNKLGALTLVVSAAIFFKYAVDNNWIGPDGRVGLGVLAGLALFGLGEYFQRREWRLFASGLVGGGNGLIFIAVYFGQQQYGNIPAPVAFGLYLLVTATAVTQALRYNALGLAVWGLAGGYLTPFLASTGSGNFVFLSSYLLVLNAGVFAVAYRRNWQPLKWMAFLLTEPYVLLWVLSYLNKPHSTPWLEFHWLLPFLWLFFIFFAAIPTWRSLRSRERIDRFGQILTVLNGIVHFGYAVLLLYDDHRMWLGIVAVVVTIIYVVILSLSARQPVVDTQGFLVFTGTAAGFLLLATPFLARGAGITLVWCAETIFLAWVCTRPRFAFLRYHVLAMLAVISVRLVGYDALLRPGWVDPQQRYIPFTHLRTYPPFAAVVAFAMAGRWLGRLPGTRVRLGWVYAVAAVVLMAGVNTEAYRCAHYFLAPHASGGLANLIQAGLLVGVIVALWHVMTARLGAQGLPWIALAGASALLVVWVMEALVWPGSYYRLTRIIGDGFGLWWLHGSVLLMATMLLLFVQLYRTAPTRAAGLSTEQIQAVCFLAAIGVTMFLLRREVFALTHAPPFADLFSETARRAAYRMVLSLSYGLLAFGIYLSAVRAGLRPRLYTAYALYVFTAFKVYLLDLESQNQLYRAFSLLIFAAILFVSSYFAQRQRRPYA